MGAKKKKAAIYTRLSRDRDGSTSIARQLEAGRQLCSARGYEIVHESTVDVDISGGKLVRPGLDEVRHLFPALDVVVFWRVDRLSRSLRDFLELAQDAQQHDVALVSATEPLDLSTPIGKAMTSIMATFAEMEREVIGLRAAASTAHLRRVGRVSGGRQPYGYRSVPAADSQGYVRAVDEAEKAVILEMIDGILAGDSRLAVARRLNERQVPPPKSGKHWSPSNVGDVLRNVALWGAVVHRGQVLRSDDGLPIVTDAVTDRDTFDAVQAALDARSSYAGRMANRRTSLLSGLLYCAECGSGLGKTTGRSYEMYRCGTKGRGGSCSGCSISAALVEEYVARRFLAKYGDWSTSNADYAASGDAEDDAPAAIRDVDRALADLEHDRYDLGLFRTEEELQRYATLYRKLSDRRVAIVAEARRVPASQPEKPTGASSTTIEDWWQDAPLDERRTLLQGLLGRITVRKGRPGVRGLDESRISFGRGLS